ncbi:maker726 [Drosophila busckii]|uniref:Maker726 n=1 Tax=Drosophila busckii TaxID=30019 RepID=A0A0M3QWN4_DROBS|nr:maker726 [Drosophila busckii]
MLKIPRKRNSPPLTPRAINIERPTPGRRLRVPNILNMMKPRTTRSQETVRVTEELNQRLVSLQTRVAEWKAMRT